MNDSTFGLLLERIGGAEWVRCKIDSAKENNPANEPTR